MAYEVFVGNRQSVEDRLNNALILGPFPDSGLAVGAKTLEFSTPLTTVTFSGSLGDVLTMEQIVSELKAAVSGLVVSKRRAQNQAPTSTNPSTGRPDPKVLLVMSHATGFTIKNTGTANADFGLSTTADTTRGATVAIGKIAGFTQDSPGHYVVVIDLS